MRDSELKYYYMVVYCLDFSTPSFSRIFFIVQDVFMRPPILQLARFQWHTLVEKGLKRFFEKNEPIGFSALTSYFSVLRVTACDNDWQFDFNWF